MILLFFSASSPPSGDEPFVAYSGFRSTGCKNKNSCKDYYLAQYANCVKNSGGVDVQGNCWAHAKPRLIACKYNPF